MSPIYVWHCVDCGSKIERFRHGHYEQPPPRTCGLCGGNMNLVINPPNLRFVGGGWDTQPAKEDDDA